MHGSLASLQAQRRQHLALELLLVEDAASTDSAPARPAGVGNQAAEPDSPSLAGPTARRAAAQLRRCYPSAVGIVEAAASVSPPDDSGPALRPAWITGSSEGSGRPPVNDGDTGASNSERNFEDLSGSSGADAAALIPSAGTGWPRKRLPWAEEAAAELRARAEANEAQRSAAEAAAAAAAASGSSSSLGGISSRLVSVRDPDWAKPWIAESKQDRRGAGSMFALVDAEPDGDGATAPESRGGRSATASSLSEASVGKARFDAVYTALREQAAVFAAAVREVRGIAGPGWPRARGAAIAAAMAEPTTSTSSHWREEAPSTSAGPALPPDGDPAAARGTIADSVDPLVLRVAVRNWVLRAAGKLPALAGLERVAADRECASDEASSATGTGASRDTSSAAAGPSTPSRPTASSTSSTSTASTSSADATRARTSASSPSGTSTPTAAKPSALDALALAARGLSDDALTQELQRTATRMRQAFRTTYVTPARSADIKLRAILDDHSRALAAMHLATAQGGKGLSTDNLKRANEGKSSMVVFDSLAWMSHGPDPDWDSCRSLLRSLRPQLLQPAASGGGGGGAGGGGAGAVAGVTRRGPKDRAAAAARATGGGGGGGGAGGAEATAAAGANRAAGVGQAARVPRRDLAMAQRAWAGFLDSMAAAQSRYEAAWKMAAREQRKGSRGDAGGGGSSGRRRRKGSADGEGGSGSDSDVGFLGNSRMQLMELNKPLKLLRAAVAGLVLMSAVGEGEVRVPDELLDPLLCAAVTFMFSAQKRVHPHVGASPTQLYHIVLYSMGLPCDIRFIYRDPLDPGSSSSPSSPRSSSQYNSGAAAGFTANEMAAYRVAHLHAFIRFQHDWFGSWLSALLARSRPESYHVLALTRLARLVDEQQLLPYEQLQLQLAQQQQQQQQQQHGQESEPPPGSGWHRAVQESAAAVPAEAAAAIEAAAAEVASVAWWHALEQEQESRIKGQQLELRDQQAQNGRPQGRGAGSGGGDPLTRFGGPGNDDDDDDDDDDHSDTDWLTGGRLQPLGAVARAPLRDSEAARQAAALADVMLRPSDHQSELLLGRVSRALRLAAEQGLLAAPAAAAAAAGSGSGSGDCSGWGAAGTGAGDAVGAEAAAVPLRRALAAAAARRLDSGLELLQTFMQTIMRANVTRDLVPFCRRLANALFTSLVREVKHGKAALGTDEIFAHLLLGSAAVSAEDCRRLVGDLVPEAAPAARGQAQARLQARTPGGSGDGGGGNGDVGWEWNWTEALRLAVAEEQAPNWRKLVGLRPGGAAAAAANSRATEGSGVGDGAPGAVQVVRYATLGLVLGRCVGLLQPHSGAQRAAGPGAMAPEQQQARAREPAPRGLSFAHCLAAGALTEELRQLGGLRVDQGAGQVGTSNSDTGASLDALMLALLRGAHFLHFLTTVPPALVPMLGGGHAAAEEAGHSGGGAGIADMGGAVAQTQGQQDGGHCGGGGAEAGRAAGTSREEGAGAAGGGPAAGASQLRRQQMRALQQLQGLARLYFREPMLAHQLARCLADFNKRRQDKQVQTPGHDADGVGGAGGPRVFGPPEQLSDEWRILVSILALRGGVGR